jgi:hypothetical protein
MVDQLWSCLFIICGLLVVEVCFLLKEIGFQSAFIPWNGREKVRLVQLASGWYLCVPKVRSHKVGKMTELQRDNLVHSQ